MDGFSVFCGPLVQDVYFFKKNGRYFANNIWFEPETKRIGKAEYERMLKIYQQSREDKAIDSSLPQEGVPE